MHTGEANSTKPARSRLTNRLQRRPPLQQLVGTDSSSTRRIASRSGTSSATSTRASRSSARSSRSAVSTSSAFAEAGGEPEDGGVTFGRVTNALVTPRLEGVPLSETDFDDLLRSIATNGC